MHDLHCHLPAFASGACDFTTRNHELADGNINSQLEHFENVFVVVVFVFLFF